MNAILLKNIKLIEIQLNQLAKIGLNHDEILSWFQVLCEELTEIVNGIGQIAKSDRKFDPPIRDSLLLYLTELLTNLSLLIQVFLKEEEINEPLLEGRKSVSRQLDFCLKGVQSTLDNNPAVICGGNFVKWMDNSLDKLSEITNAQKPIKAELCEETRSLFEEVLSHAMSLAQVCLEQDRTMIRGACQTVLQNLNGLIGEIKETQPNPAMIKISLDTCSTKLCNLERKVNTAVLKLCLKTFTEYTTPLKTLKHFCSNPNNDKNELFDDIIVDFDLHVDRIMQIALFAVSCSSDIKRGIEIRSCLASLEAMESELVPAFSANLSDPCKQNSNYVQLLEDHWLKQAKTLQKLICLILDPFAFCEVIYEEASTLVDDFNELIEGQHCNLKENDVIRLVKVGNILKMFLDVAKVEFSEEETVPLEKNLRNFHKVLQEVKGASKILLGGKTPNFRDSLRVVKRCRVLLTMIKRIWYCFALNIKENESIDEVKPPELINNPFLNHIINRGRQILQNRSILYRSPMKQAQSNAITKRSTITSDVTSLDLQISAILNEITNLSTSFY